MDKPKKEVKAKGRRQRDTGQSAETESEVGDRYRVEEFRKRIAELSRSKEMLEKVNESMRDEIKKITRDHRLLSEKLLEMLEKDRRDLAMMLYDHAGQVLIALKMNIEELEKKELDSDMRNSLYAAKKKASDLIEFIRKTSRKLRPSVLDNLGLVPATRSLVNDFRRRIDTPIVFFTAGLEERLPPEKETALFRILQESLNNSIRHASAGRIYISLIKKGDRVLLSIEDDGEGFDCNTTSKSGRNRKEGAGIALMKVRTLHAGGEFWIESRPGRGTSVMAEIPAD